MAITNGSWAEFCAEAHFALAQRRIIKDRHPFFNASVGSENKSKKQDIDLLCQQYAVRSGTTDYTIRQPKPSEEAIMVISQAAASSPAAAPASSAPNHQ